MFCLINVPTNNIFNVLLKFNKKNNLKHQIKKIQNSKFSPKLIKYMF